MNVAQNKAMAQACAGHGVKIATQILTALFGVQFALEVVFHAEGLGLGLHHDRSITRSRAGKIGFEWNKPLELIYFLPNAD